MQCRLRLQRVASLLYSGVQMTRKRTENEQLEYLQTSRVRVPLDDDSLRQLEKRAADLGLSRERFLRQTLRGLARWYASLSASQVARFEFVIQHTDSTSFNRFMKAVDAVALD